MPQLARDKTLRFSPLLVNHASRRIPKRRDQKYEQKRDRNYADKKDGVLKMDRAGRSIQKPVFKL